MTRLSRGDHQTGDIRSGKATAARPLPESETQFISYFDSLPCVIYECGLDLVVTALSPNAFEVIGIHPEGALGTAVWRDRLAAADRIRFYSKMDELAPSEIASVTHRIINDQGATLWVAHSFRKIVRDDRTIISGCILPLAADDRAAAIDPAVIHQLVHRIGNHFQLINLLIDSLRRKDARLAEIEDIQQTVDRAVELTRSFSHYSQPPTLTESVAIGAVLRSLIESWTPCFREKSVAVETTFHPPFDRAAVVADPSMLESAFGFVLENALEATKSGDRLVVEGSTQSCGNDGGTLARILIRDSGNGMNKDEVAKAVTPFSTTKRDHEGLGFSTAVRIIELHGGVVSIASQPGRGTDVIIVLPVNDFAGCSV